MGTGRFEARPGWRWLAALVFIAVGLWPAAAAHATAPTLTATAGSAGDSADIVAAWTLAPEMRNYSIEVARSPETYQGGAGDGGFRMENLAEVAILLQRESTSWISMSLPRQTYYVHVSAYDSTTCTSPLAIGCAVEWSETREVVIPALAPTVAQAGNRLRRLTAGWSLPDRMYSRFIEVATHPDRNQSGPFKGQFLGENLVWYDGSLSPGDTSYETPGPLPGGTYYVHVGASTCEVAGGSSCTEIVSKPPVEVTIPPNAPLLASASQVDGRVTLTWALGPGSRSDFVEVATSPEVYEHGTLRGYFLDEHTVLYDDALDPGQTDYEAPEALEPGTYYAHVAAYETGTCPTFDAPTCFDEFSNAIPIVIPALAPPASPGEPAAAAAPDTATAFSSLRARSRQSVRRVYVIAAMPEPGTITVRGSVAVPSTARVFRFRPVTRRAAAGQRVRLVLRLPRKARRAARRALRRRKRLKARITIVARDRAGNTKTARRTIRLGR